MAEAHREAVQPVRQMADAIRSRRGETRPLPVADALPGSAIPVRHPPRRPPMTEGERGELLRRGQARLARGERPRNVD